ncbi:MAG: type II toxin-antitoxin system VapC family toxin [Chloroflexota bacterium]|nr:type II toxin-antitoxin system VapC family toxin [Chloroflexota bacterium]
MYLLDTDWIIEAFGGRQPATQSLDRLANSPIYVTYVSVGEVYERAFQSVSPQAHLVSVRQFLGEYQMLTLTDSIMERFAELRFFLRRRGQLIPNFDLVIAATALQYGLTLLSFNRRHFERIPDLRLYQLA